MYCGSRSVTDSRNTQWGRSRSIYAYVLTEVAADHFRQYERKAEKGGRP